MNRDQVLRWMIFHPWSWLVLFLLALICFAIWLAEPITWRNGEGSLIDDGQRFARAANGGVHSPLRWVRGAARSLWRQRRKKKDRR